MSEPNEPGSETRESEALESWIVEIRRRLSDPPPLRLVAPSGNGKGGNGAPAAAAREGPRRAAALVTLWVDAGELWTLVTERVQRLAGHQSPPAFPGALAEAAESAWEAALRGGTREAGLDTRAALDLGRLDEVRTPADVVIAPCVAALPAKIVGERGEPADRAAVERVVALPLSALAQPRLMERRPVEVGGQAAEIVILHVGKRRIWGVTAEVVLNLLRRLGMTPPEEA
jgi:ADP-ribose pyrophosphatase YjhB (NUDIX family)